MTGFAYIDFETSRASDYYMVGTQIGTQFRQVVLTKRLSGFAKHHKLNLLSPEEFADQFCRYCKDHQLCIVAYSTAEKISLENLTDCHGLGYLNLRTAAKTWVRKYKRADCEALPELGKTMNLLPHQRRQLRNSLFSVSRLLTESQLDGLKIPQFRNYGWGHVSTWFKMTIKGLEQRDQDYANLAKSIKKKGTRALSHNRFDVRILPRLHQVIEQTDQRIIESSVTQMSYGQNVTRTAAK